MISTNLLFENYILSDKTISVDINKFESGEANKLLIVGFSGSGKTTLGQKLAKQYQTKYIDLDDCWKNTNVEYIPKDREDEIYHQCVNKKINQNNSRSVIEGIGIIEFYKINQKNKNYILNLPIVFLGKSALLSSIDASKRDQLGLLSFLELLPNRLSVNLNMLSKPLNQLRKDRISVVGSTVKEI